MHYLSLEEILQLHFWVVKEFGGSHGVRDESPLHSLVIAPTLEAFGVEQYATVYDKAAVYMRNVIGDHPFIDGNKRTGVTIGGVFLARNNVHLTATPDELEDFAVQIATDHLDAETIAQWLEARSQR